MLYALLVRFDPERQQAEETEFCERGIPFHGRTLPGLARGGAWSVAPERSSERPAVRMSDLALGLRMGVIDSSLPKGRHP